VLIFVEIALDEFFEILQSHIPGLLLFLAHPVVSLCAYSRSDVVFKAIVEKSRAA
jgi:hypothetical protein